MLKHKFKSLFRLDKTENEILLEEDISLHVFSGSAMMIASCLTAISVISLIVQSHKIQTFADDLLSLATFSFILACLMAYFAIRQRRKARIFAIEKIADIFFLGGMLMTACVGLLLVYAL